MLVDADAKKRLAAERTMARDQKRQQRRRERRCFWTRPFGHKYRGDRATMRDGWEACVGCDREIYVGPHG